MQPQPYYYNTLKQQGLTLTKSAKKAAKQEEVILALFESNPERDYTPFEVMEILNLNFPITSIRRSITNLTSKGMLIKLDKKRAGIYGDNNYCWKLNKNPNIQPTLF